MPETGPSGGSHSAGGVAGGMRRRPIDVHRKLPLVRSQKELTLDDDTNVANDVVRAPAFPLTSTTGAACASAPLREVWFLCQKAPSASLSLRCAIMCISQPQHLTILGKRPALGSVPV